jgi:carbon starvation protein CstA
MMVNFDILWRYFAWVNQTLSVFTLWAITVWLGLRCRRDGHSKFEVLIGLIPALWMTMICTSYILIAPEGFGMHPDYAYAITGIVVICFFVSFLSWYKRI